MPAIHQTLNFLRILTGQRIETGAATPSGILFECRYTIQRAFRVGGIIDAGRRIMVTAIRL